MSAYVCTKPLNRVACSKNLQVLTFIAELSFPKTRNKTRIYSYYYYYDDDDDDDGDGDGDEYIRCLHLTLPNVWLMCWWFPGRAMHCRPQVKRPRGKTRTSHSTIRSKYSAVYYFSTYSIRRFGRPSLLGSLRRDVFRSRLVWRLSFAFGEGRTRQTDRQTDRQTHWAYVQSFLVRKDTVPV